jgi:hypothetical protein
MRWGSPGGIRLTVDGKNPAAAPHRPADHAAPWPAVTQIARFGTCYGGDGSERIAAHRRIRCVKRTGGS